MNFFNVLNKRIEDLELVEAFNPFYKALLANKNDQFVSEVIDCCNTNYFYIEVSKYENNNKYDFGRITISFDDESELHNKIYYIHLSFTSNNKTYLPKILIERNEFLKGFVYQN